jgi:hypothetical protein
MSLYTPGVTFVHIPKTAGTSILHWLETNCGNSEQIKWEEHPKHSTILEQCGNNFSFAVVRNPWDRMVSWYFYLKVVAMREGSGWLALNNVTTENFPKFEDWLVNLHTYKNPDGYWFTGLTNQHEWLDVPIDLLIRYETLASEFVKIQDIVKCYRPLPFLYVSGHSNYQSYYNNTTRKFVEQQFAQDIDLYKYTFNG